MFLFELNPARLGTVDFLSKEGKLVFRTCAEEKSRVVFQLVKFLLFLSCFFFSCAFCAVLCV